MLDNIWDWLRERWWGQLVCAAFFFGLAALVYWDISRQEPDRYVDLHWFLALIYPTFGKWGCVAFFALPGLLSTFCGIWNGIAVFQAKHDGEDGN